ncbi:MAG TPA: TIGR03435 family protein [Bryobacteraceae bacterium]|nr:TIGR03435 family protein [Bryobacteraceae bacterium]
MVRAVTILAVCVTGAVYAQSTVGQRFEVASVKPSGADSNSSSGIKTGHGHLDANNVTLKRCIMGAYGVGPHQIFGGPDWLESDRFQILAKADQPINEDAVLMAMLQDLLAERFKLAFHRETRIMRAFVLEVAKKGPKLEKAEAGESVTNTSTNNTGAVVDAHNTDMDSFAKILSRKMDLPVVDNTRLEGTYNFKLRWTPESARPGDGAAMEGASIFTAIQEQLGLRLRSQKITVEVLVIDHAEKPSEN